MATKIFHFSNTGISSGQKYYLKDDVSGIFVRNLNIDSNFPIVAPNLVYNTENQTISGIKTFSNGINQLFFNVNSNFTISGNRHSQMILANASSQITGTIVSGNATGFNTSIIQIGAGQIQITGSGIGIGISSYNNQFKTAGQFATISLLHTGNNRYIMYGNTI